MLSDQFAQLVSLPKKITDYNADEEQKVDPDEERKKAEIEEGGVAVVIDEEEQEEEDEEDYEMKDETDEEDEENDQVEQEVTGEEPEEDIVIGGETSRKSKSEAGKDIVSPHSIDGFRVQRQISEIYPDPVTAAEKATSVINILSSDSSPRDCENQLMELFDYDSYPVIAIFLKKSRGYCLVYETDAE